MSEVTEKKKELEATIRSIDLELKLDYDYEHLLIILR